MAIHTVRIVRSSRQQGFTLLEVLIVLVLFTVITAIIYATFSTVVNSSEAVRTDVERLRLQEYLVRSMTTNLSTVYTDVLDEDANFNFIGIDFENEDGPADSLTLCSTAPLIGGFSLPGDLKLVTYEIPGVMDEDLFLNEDRSRAAADYEASVKDGDAVDNPYDLGRKFSISETPLMTGNTRSMQGNLEDDEGIFEANEDLRARSRGRDAFSGGAYGERDNTDDLDRQRRREDGERRREERRQPRPSDYMDEDAPADEPITNKAMFQTPYMEMPIRTLDIEYFDGEEWVKEWNSSAYDNQLQDQSPAQGQALNLNKHPTPEPMGRLPWAVRFRINFEKTAEELAQDRKDGLIEDEDVDFEMVVPVHQGQGITQHVYEVPELQNLVPGYVGPGAVPVAEGEGEGERGGPSNTPGPNSGFGTRGQ